MRYIMSQTGTTKFKWQLQVLIKNLTSLGVAPSDIYAIIIKTIDSDPKTIPTLKKLGVNVYEYKPAIEFNSVRYIAYVKPYGLYRFFSEHPEAIPYTYMYQDSDVVYKALVDENKLQVSAKHWVGSETGSYTGLSYIESKGTELVDLMATDAGVNPSTIHGLGDNVPGAQIVISSPNPEWFKQSYERCFKLYQHLTSIEPKYKHKYAEAGNPDEYPIQRWTAQMWTDVWIPADAGVLMTTDPELDFCFATNKYDDMNDIKIYHDAGVSAEDSDMFFKGKYDHGTEPFGEDFSYVDKDKASYFYVQAIEKV